MGKHSIRDRGVSMKNKYKYIIVTALLFLGIALFLYYQLAVFVVYKVEADGWEEVYRSIDQDKAYGRFNELRYSLDGNMYIFVDEESGNSIIQ